VAGGSSEARPVERGADLLGATNEVERFDVLQADLREPGKRPAHVGGKLLGEGVQLHRGCGEGHVVLTSKLTRVTGSVSPGSARSRRTDPGELAQTSERLGDRPTQRT
jgi:hypothetical protein